MRALRRPSAALLCASAVALACDRSRPPATRDTVTAAAPTPPVDTATASPPDTTRWAPAAGPVLVVAGGTPAQGFVVFPEFTDSTLTDSTVFDTSVVRSARVDLFGRGGPVGQAALVPANAGTVSDDCTSWPRARVVARGRLPAAWTVGLLAGRATAIPLDSIESLSPADSFKLAAEVTRLAAALPNDTGASFHGIPFTVRSVRRFAAAPGVAALTAQVARNVNQEATPRVEQIFLVAERDSAPPDAPYAAAYYERSSGPEETVETREVLAVVRLARTLNPLIVLNRDYGDGTAYALLERVAPRKWRVRWSSAYTGC